MSFSANGISLRPGEVEMKILQSWRQALLTSPPSQSSRGSRPNLARDPNKSRPKYILRETQMESCSQATEILTFLYYANEESDDLTGGSTKTVQHSIGP